MIKTEILVTKRMAWPVGSDKWKAPYDYKESNREISISTFIASVKVLIVTNVQKTKCNKL